MKRSVCLGIMAACLALRSTAEAQTPQSVFAAAIPQSVLATGMGEYEIPLAPGGVQNPVMVCGPTGCTLVQPNAPIVVAPRRVQQAQHFQGQPVMTCGPNGCTVGYAVPQYAPANYSYAQGPPMYQGGDCSTGNCGVQGYGNAQGYGNGPVQQSYGNARPVRGFFRGGGFRGGRGGGRCGSGGCS